ncbi:MAG: dienelactone hydrolase family protein [bacterium]|nr:dienelactone hydrolase family protein [bacterium]
MVKFFRVLFRWIVILLSTFNFLFAEVEIIVPSFDKTEIEVVYHNGQENDPFVILISDKDSDLEQWKLFKDKLLDKGWGFLGYVPRVFEYGKEHRGTRKLWRKKSRYATGILLRDLDAILMYLELNYQTQINTNRIILVGAGLGANIALIYAVSNKNIKEVVLISPGREYGAVSTRSAILSYGNRPIMFMASEEDDYSYQTCLDYITYLSGSNSFRVKFYYVNKHGMEFLTDYKVIRDIFSWLELHN